MPGGPETAEVRTPGYPPFDPHRSRFNLATYTGRLSQVLVQFDPLKLLISNAELDRAKALVESYKQKRLPPDTSSKALWTAKEKIDALCHPDDGGDIPRIFAFASYVPVQPPIIVGMLWPGGGIANQVFWQWFNQSYNAMSGYYNKNKSSQMTNSEIGAAYVGSVISAVGLSTGVRKLGTMMPPGAIGSLVAKSAPFCGVVGAGCVSLIMMRYNELQDGVVLKDEHGKAYGKSKLAAREGIGKCCLARFVWNVPIFVLGPLSVGVLNSTKFAKTNPRGRMFTEVLLLTGCICLGIYPAQAIFSQTASIPVERTEAEFRSTGVTQFFYNKGL